MTSTSPHIRYYVDHFYRGEPRKKIIDFDLGLGRFLTNSGTMSNRILLGLGQKLDLEPHYTYRRYYFDIATHRFAYDLEFTDGHFQAGTLLWSEDRERIIHSDARVLATLNGLGVRNSPDNLNTILSKKRRK